MAGEYGLVVWWLKSHGYSSTDFEIENTYDKTKDKSINSIYDKIMKDAQNATSNNKLSNALKDLAESNRNFRREHQIDIDTTAESSIQEFFKNGVREEVDAQLSTITIDTGQKNKIRSAVIGEFENIKIDNIPTIVDENVREVIRTEVVEIPIMKEASLDVIGVELSEEDWVGLRYLAFVENDSDARSQYMKISRRMRTL